MPVYLIQIAEGTHEAVENQTLLEIATALAATQGGLIWLNYL